MAPNILYIINPSCDNEMSGAKHTFIGLQIGKGENKFAYQKIVNVMHLEIIV
jgi:hypothetical protein